MKILALTLIAKKMTYVEFTKNSARVKLDGERFVYQLKDNVHTLGGKLKQHCDVEVNEAVKLEPAEILLPTQLNLQKGEKLEVFVEKVVEVREPMRVLDFDEKSGDDLFVVPGYL